MHVSMIIGIILFCGTVHAADCPAGDFCVWTEAEYKGKRVNFSRDVSNWEDGIKHRDSSWANHSIKDSVEVYSEPNFEGQVTICLPPGQEAPWGHIANRKGASHKFVSSCD